MSETTDPKDIAATAEAKEVPAASEPAVADRWWVDATDTEKNRPKPVQVPVAAQFYRSAQGFEQEKARERLRDNNWKVVAAANPPEGGWVNVPFAETKFSEREIEKIKEQIALPSYARGVIADSGRCVRLLVTGNPPGERLLELTLGDDPSFDCWIRNEWVDESRFQNRSHALKVFRRLVRKYLAPEAIAEYQSIVAQA